jgi:hypothetical protein
MPRLSHPSWLHYSNNTWRRVQIVKLSPHLSSVQISSSVPCSQHPQPMFHPKWQRPIFTPIQNHRQNYSLVSRPISCIKAMWNSYFYLLILNETRPGSLIVKKGKGSVGLNMIIPSALRHWVPHVFLVKQSYLWHFLRFRWFRYFPYDIYRIIQNGRRIVSEVYYSISVSTLCSYLQKCWIQTVRIL